MECKLAKRQIELACIDYLQFCLKSASVIQTAITDIARDAVASESMRRLVETENVTNKPKEYYAASTEAAEAT